MSKKLSYSMSNTAKMALALRDQPEVYNSLLESLVSSVSFKDMREFQEAGCPPYFFTHKKIKTDQEVRRLEKEVSDLRNAVKRLTKSEEALWRRLASVQSGSK